MKCSALNAHLCRRNIVPRPSCICNGFESSYFFLFVCPRYIVPYNLTNNTTHDLLFWKESKPVSEKERLFLQVQDSIIKSGRLVKDIALVRNYVIICTYL